MVYAEKEREEELYREYIEPDTKHARERKPEKKSSSFEGFLKKHEKEIELIQHEFKSYGKHGVSKAGIKELLVDIWKNAKTDQEALTKAKRVLKILLIYPSLYKGLKLVPEGLKKFLSSAKGIAKNIVKKVLKK